MIPLSVSAKVIQFINAFVLLLAFFTCNQATGQPPDSIWSRVYGGEVDEECKSIAKTQGGGLFLAGFTTSVVGGSFDFWLERVNDNGGHLWSRAYGGSNVESCQKVLPESDGGCVLAGYTGSIGAGDFDVWLIRVDSLGEIIWNRTFGASNRDQCFDAIQTNDGGYLLAGLTRSFGAQNSDIWVIKVSSTGDSLWSRKFGGSGQDVATSIIECEDGCIVFTGITGSFGDADGDVLLQKLSPSGDSLWAHTYGGTLQDNPWSIERTPNGGYAIAGYTTSMGAGASDFYFIVTDEFGIESFHRTYGGPLVEQCFDMVPLAADGYLLTGLTGSYGEGSYDMWAIRLNTNGDSIWSVTFGTNRDEACNAVQVDRGNYYLAGYLDIDNEGISDFWLLKTGFDSTLDASEVLHLPASFGLSAYPNPFNSKVQIEYTIDMPGRAELKAFNMLGQEVATLISNHASSVGAYRLNWDAMDSRGRPLTSGAYLLELNNSGQRAVHKVLLVR